MSTRGRSRPIFLLQGPCRDWKERAGHRSERCDQEEFQGEWAAPAPGFSAAHPKLTAWSEGTEVLSAPAEWFSTADRSAQRPLLGPRDG